MCENVTMCSEGQGKERKKFGRMIDVAKKIRLQSHETRADCKCKRLKCFENVSPAARVSVIKHFNLFKTTDEQNIYLCGLISVHPVQLYERREGVMMCCSCSQPKLLFAQVAV